MKIIHAADLHLDSPLQGLSRYEGAPVERLRNATRQAFERIIELCLEHEAAALLLAGDNFDSDWRDFRTGLFLVNQLNRLRDTSTEVLMVRGNHDSHSEVSKSLTLPDHVHEFSSRTVETVMLADDSVAVHGTSYPQREVTENLLPRYPAPVPGAVNVGLLHTNVGSKGEHANYAPCSVQELTNRGYDYWALGHVHERQVLHADPHIVYAGCPQGRHVRESGAKGCVILEVDGGGVESVEFIDTDVIRWEKLTISPEPGRGSVEELIGQCAKALTDATDGLDRTLATRLEFRGEFGAIDELGRRQEWFEAELRALPSHLGRDVWIEKVVSTLRPPLERRADTLLIAALERRLADLSQGADLPTDFLDALLEKARTDLEAAGLDLSDTNTVRALLPQVEAVLLSELQTGGSAP